MRWVGWMAGVLLSGCASIQTPDCKHHWIRYGNGTHQLDPNTMEMRSKFFKTEADAVRWCTEHRCCLNEPTKQKGGDDSTIIDRSARCDCY